MKQTRLIQLILNLLLNAVLLAGPARAIDCTKATTKLDKIICADPKLIEADAKLNDAYVRAMTARSPEGKAALRASQKEWLKGIAAEAEKSDTGIDHSFAVRQAELEMPLNDVAQKIADRINADQQAGMEQIPSFEASQTESTPIKSGDAFTAKLRSMPVEAGLGDKLVAALDEVSGQREYQSFDINDDGIKDFRIDVIGGTLQCSTPRYLVSSKSHPGKFDVLDFAPEDLCAVGGDGTGAGYNDAVIDGKHYVVAKQQEQASTRYEFYDVLAKPITGSRLDIAFNEHYSLSSDVSSCNIPGCAKLIGNIGKLFKEGTPADDLPKQATGPDKLLTRHGTLISRQDVEKLALPLLEAEAKSEDPKPDDDGFKHGIREIFFADINNDGSPDLGASIFDSESWSEKLLFVESSNGLWNDPSKLRIVDLSKDFPGYDIGRVSGSDDDYVGWYFGSIMRLRFDGKGKAHIFRAGAKKFGADNWICCAIEIDKIVGEKVQSEFSSDVEKSKSIRSVKVDAVVTSPHGDVVWYTGP